MEVLNHKAGGFACSYVACAAFARVSGWSIPVQRWMWAGGGRKLRGVMAEIRKDRLTGFKHRDQGCPGGSLPGALLRQPRGGTPQRAGPSYGLPGQPAIPRVASYQVVQSYSAPPAHYCSALDNRQRQRGPPSAPWLVPCRERRAHRRSPWSSKTMTCSVAIRQRSRSPTRMSSRAGWIERSTPPSASFRS